MKEFVDEIFYKSFSLAQPKFDVKMIILRKLTILDSLLYPIEKKITKKYSDFDNWIRWYRILKFIQKVVTKFKGKPLKIYS